MFYLYDQFTKRFTNFTYGQKSPLEKNKRVQPLFSTTLPPPEDYSINEIPVFNESLGVWELGESDYFKEKEKAKFEEENEHGIKIYEEDEKGKPVKKKQSKLDAEKLEKETKEKEEKKLQDLGQLIQEKEFNRSKKQYEMVGETNLIFLTSRITNPSLYINKGLTVSYPILNFLNGDALDTEEKVSQYYAAILAELDLFIIDLDAQYEIDKALIENS